jgi:hypothetical protein
MNVTVLIAEVQARASFISLDSDMPETPIILSGRMPCTVRHD